MAAVINVGTGQVGFLGWLTLIFITLKLTGYVAWSWFWVLSPLLIPLGVVGVVFVICGILAVLSSLIR